MIECLDLLGSYYRLPSLADVKRTEATTTRARAKFIYSTREVTLTMATGEVPEVPATSSNSMETAIKSLTQVVQNL